MTTNPLLEGLDALDGKAVRERLIEARRAAVAYVAAHDDMGLQQTIEMTDGIVQRAMREAVRSLCRIMDDCAGSRAAAQAARCLPVPPAVKRPGPADFAAAAQAGAARNAARPPSPMRRVPAPVRAPEEYVADAGVAAPVAAAPPAPAPAPKRSGLANLRRPVAEDAPPEPEASTPASAAPAVEHPVPPIRKPKVDVASLDPIKLRALRARERNARALPFIRPSGEPDWSLPAWDPEDDEIPW